LDKSKYLQHPISSKGRDFLKTCVILWYKKTLVLNIDQQRR